MPLYKNKLMKYLPHKFSSAPNKFSQNLAHLTKPTTSVVPTILSPVIPEQIDNVPSEPNESASFEIEDKNSKESKHDKNYLDEFAATEIKLQQTGKAMIEPKESASSEIIDQKSEEVNDFHAENINKKKKEKISGRKQKALAQKHAKAMHLKDNDKMPEIKCHQINKRRAVVDERKEVKKNCKQTVDDTVPQLMSQEQSQSSSLADSLMLYFWSQREVLEVDPPPSLSHRDRLLWLQEQRNVGLYVVCDKCDKYRYLENVKDPLELPEVWYCYMNPDKDHNDCSIPEVELTADELELLIDNSYHAGSIVWAKVVGYPWWPAMVDDCPDTEMYYWMDNIYTDTPSEYHVVFFDSHTVSRAWLKTCAIRKFKGNIDNPKFQVAKRHSGFRKRIEFAKNQALEALSCDLPERLKRYSFISRWPKRINKPIDVHFESENESDTVMTQKCTGKKNGGVIGGGVKILEKRKLFKKVGDQVMGEKKRFKKVKSRKRVDARQLYTDTARKTHDQIDANITRDSGIDSEMSSMAPTFTSNNLNVFLKDRMDQLVSPDIFNDSSTLTQDINTVPTGLKYDLV